DGDESEGQAAEQGTEPVVAKLGSQRINNLFTHLRKIALHPLLVRHRYTDAMLEDMVSLATRHGLFGGQCTVERVGKEMNGWSDFQLHNFAESYRGVLGHYALEAECLMTSGKLKELTRLLPPMKAKGSRVLLFSQWT
ncbi:helicase C-terminal domain-containing protein, partial [Haematococcus lacustris]